MNHQPPNRMAMPETRKQGRPPASQPPQPEVEAPPVMVDDAILPCKCPNCGRGMQPRVVRRRPTGERDCTCALCGQAFIYRPATVRTA